MRCLLRSADKPLFVSKGHEPFRHHPLATIFHALLSIVVGAEAAPRYSIHSFRIYLACALLAASASHGTIQTMLRWKSDDALRIYARINDFKYADWLERAGLAQVTSVRTTTAALNGEAAAVEAATAAHDRVSRTIAPPAGAAAAAFQSDLRDRAASAASAAIAAAQANLPEHDADARYRALATSMTTLRSAAEAADALGLD